MAATYETLGTIGELASSLGPDAVFKVRLIRKDGELVVDFRVFVRNGEVPTGKGFMLPLSEIPAFREVIENTDLAIKGLQ